MPYARCEPAILILVHSYDPNSGRNGWLALVDDVLDSRIFLSDYARRSNVLALFPHGPFDLVVYRWAKAKPLRRGQKTSWLQKRTKKENKRGMNN